jgi:hypothetical protein
MSAFGDKNKMSAFSDILLREVSPDSADWLMSIQGNKMIFIQFVYVLLWARPMPPLGGGSVYPGYR